MPRTLALLRSPVVRWAFLLAAVALAVVAVASSWDEVRAAAAGMPAAHLAAAAAAAAVFVWCTFQSWRALLADLGSSLPLGPAVTVFGVSQVGKYVPGGVWNVVAAAEIGADHRVPRARSLAAMALSVLVGVVSGCVVAAVSLPLAGAGALGRWEWLVWCSPLLVVLLLPPVLGRLVGLALRLLRRGEPERPLSWGGLGRAVGWAVLGWVVAGLHVWALASGLGLAPSVRSAALAVGGYALAWVAGFVVVLVPAGAGVREAVLLALLAGSLPHAQVLLVVLLSRVLLTAVDLAFAVAGLAVRRDRRRRPPVAAAPEG
ncbi:UPF0104 family protein [Xylanimonas oleitrophica]|uniref:UPF0104 family protein n=1 Tax=Xylanimonas oleitrophica TaxID=2607479 RepID=A0A2W5WUB7_9MICO|nr:UPF0104 family protein [Xylanimonas oleitrophica]